MSITEIENNLKRLRLSGMSQTVQGRNIQAIEGKMSFQEGLSNLIQDELDRRGTSLVERRFSLSGLTERKFIKDFDWGFNPKVPKHLIVDLLSLRFIEKKEDALFIGSSGTGKSHIAKSLALLAIQSGYDVFYREAHHLLSDIQDAEIFSRVKKLKNQIFKADIVIIDDLFLRKVHPQAAEEICEIVMERYEKGSTLITSNRVIEDWGKMLGDEVIVGPILDRIMHHGHMVRFEGKSWRLSAATQRLAKSKSVN